MQARTCMHYSRTANLGHETDPYQMPRVIPCLVNVKPSIWMLQDTLGVLDTPTWTCTVGPANQGPFY